MFVGNYVGMKENVRKRKITYFRVWFISTKYVYWENSKGSLFEMDIYTEIMAAYKNSINAFFVYEWIIISFEIRLLSVKYSQ